MSLARSTVLTLGLAAVLGSAQGSSKTLDPVFGSFVLAAHERQRDAAPTPTVHVARRAGLNRRLDSTTSFYVVTGVPDSTCGFLSASPGNPITCENGGYCSWAPNNITAIVCDAIGEPLSMKSTCLERSEATNTLVCNDVCQGGEFNLLCTNETAPFCRTYIFPSGVTDFRCASTSVAQPQSIDFTYKGQTDRVFETSTWSRTISASSTSSLSSSSKTEESSTTSTTSTPSVIVSPTPDPDPDPAPSTNVGVIVGGVVGGVAVLALIGFGIFFMLRRRAAKSAQAGDKNDAHNPGGTQPQPVQQYHYAVSGASPVPAEGWMGPPAQSPLTTPVGGATYDNFSDIHTTRMSKVHSPETTEISQPTIVPGTIHEVDADTTGHHRGGLHEMRSE